MSVNSPSLKNRVLIGAIIIAGVGVTVLNIKTFGPAARPGRRVQASLQDQPVLPPDLALLVHAAMSGGPPGIKPVTQGKKHLPDLHRDPFRARTAPVAATAKAPGAKPAARKRRGLVCSAIMTGGKRPSALINDRFYSPGDKIGGYTLAWIATTGVTLRTGTGAKKFLPLAGASRQNGTLTVKMGPKPSANRK